MPRRILTLLTLVALTVTGLAALGSAPAGAAVPHPHRVFTSSIEGYTEYVPQDSCDPRPKRGTTMVGDMLTHTYRGTTWSSYRPCDGSVSEHHDGRAIDWMVSSRNKTQLNQGRAFWHWLLATDRFGNKFAMARRLGVMYIIFNGRMWGSWDGKWEEYMHCRTTQRSRAMDNSCHRTHMHISLSWNGARGLTSYWTGREYDTDYGPCVPRHKKYAPRWTHRNFTPCH